MEVWKESVDPAFEVSDRGGIRSSKTKRPRKQWINSLGYVVVSLRNPATDRYRRFRLHRVIWEAFKGPVPSGLTVDHKDRSRCNNALDNLRLVTRKRNQLNRSKSVTGTRSIFLGVSRRRRTSGRWYARTRIGADDYHTPPQAYEISAALDRDDMMVRLHGHESVSLNFPGRYGLQTPSAARGTITLSTVAAGFAWGMRSLWVTIDRAAISTQAVTADRLLAIEHDGQMFIRAVDAAGWHISNLSSFPSPMQAIRLALQFAGAPA